MAKWGMVIDLEKCTGCQACTVACGMENSRLPGEHWQDVIFFNEGEYPNTELKWFPRPCMHCENPSCVAVCPTKATYKNESGQVLVDWERCIGCKYCMVACPYGVRFYTEEKPAYGGPNVKDVFPTGLPKGMNALVFNTRRPVFSDIRVREAIAMLFDFSSEIRTIQLNF